MKKHRILFYREVVVETIIEAVDMDEALDKFVKGEYVGGSVVNNSPSYDELIHIEELENTISSGFNNLLN